MKVLTQRFAASIGRYDGPEAEALFLSLVGNARTVDDALAQSAYNQAASQAGQNMILLDPATLEAVA